MMSLHALAEWVLKFLSHLRYTSTTTTLAHGLMSLLASFLPNDTNAKFASVNEPLV